jgi:hypothetical protein
MKKSDWTKYKKKDQVNDKLIINLILYLGGKHGSVLLIATYDGLKRHTLSFNWCEEDLW